MDIFASIWFAATTFTFVACIVATVWFIVRAFQEHLLWGLAVLFLPMAQIVFAVLHWDRARRPFLLGLAAAVALVLEMLVGSGFAALLGE